LTEIIGEYEGIFDTHSDSIYAEDCNFDGFPDLAFKDEDKETYTSIYFFNNEKHSFFEYPFIKNLALPGLLEFLSHFIMLHNSQL
jgi:hypothetical protein